MWTRSDRDTPALELQGERCTYRLKKAGTPGQFAWVRLLPNGATIYCDVGPPRLRFGRVIERTGVQESGELLDELGLLVRHPKHCHWRQTAILAQGAGSEPVRRVGGRYYPHIGKGDARVRPAMPGAGATALSCMTAAEVVPGDLLSLEWTFWDGQEAKPMAHPGGYFETPCLRGGRVVETAGEPGEEDRRYLVEGHGLLVVAAASDHVPYALGDWVYYSLVSHQCLSCRWFDSYMTLNSTDSTGGSQMLPEPEPRPPFSAGQPPQAVILPLVCGGMQAETPAFQAYAMPEVTPYPMGDVLDFCLRKALLIEVDGNGEASLELPWGRVDGVPVHYHCPDAADVAGGHGAFQPDDEVLVVSSREQQVAHAVIGFADKIPRPCKEYIVISTGLPHMGGREFYLVWDVTTGELARDIPDGAGGLLDPSNFPCERAMLEPWFEASRIIEPYDEMSNLLEAQRIGFLDTVNARLDDQPHPQRYGAAMHCTLSEPCPSFGWLGLGELCGECEETSETANAHQGMDTGRFTKLVEASFDEVSEVSEVFERRTWRDEHPYIRCVRDVAGPHPPSSCLCQWGSFSAELQASRIYQATQDIWFDSDLVQDLMIFEERVTDRVAFPGIPHRASLEWTDVTTSSRPVVNPDGPRSWRWEDRAVTLGGFGLRTQRSWCFAYVCITRPWHMDLIEDPPVKTRAPQF